MIPAEVKSVYLAGPMRNLPEYNFPAFHDAATELRVYPHNLKVVSPAEHDEDGGFNPKTDTLDTFDLFTAMKWDLHAVLDSDAVVVLPGWEKSKGVAHELNAARAAGIPVYRYPDLTEVAIESDEERVVNPITGGVKGKKLARFDLLPSDAVWALAEHFGKGSLKYSDRNWELGTDYSLNFAAAQRHLWQWWSGENIDIETGSSHLIAAMWHMAALYHCLTTHPELDDRPK